MIDCVVRERQQARMALSISGLSSWREGFITLCQAYFHCFICFPVCALVSFVLVDIIFGFLCLPGQSIVLYSFGLF